jgi:hypothetical protein
VPGEVCAPEIRRRACLQVSGVWVGKHSQSGREESEVNGLEIELGRS